MWSQERHHRIMALLVKRHRLTSDQLAEELGVSRETIRRDLIELETDGRLARVHGGAVAVTSTRGEEPYHERAQLRRLEKQAIARAALSFIEPGQSCFVDAGTTTLAFAEELVKLGGIQVITNSIGIAQLLGQKTDFDVLLLGGRVLSDVPATYGEVTLEEIRRFSVDIAVLSPVAIDGERGAMDFALHEAEIARAMLANAKTSVLLADHGKLGLRSRIQICPITEIDILVTDSGSEAAMLEGLKEAGVRQIVTASATRVRSSPAAKPGRRTYRGAVG